MIEVGDKVRYWFAPEGTEVLSIRPYKGAYPEHFTHFVTLKNDRVRSGSTEVVWKDDAAHNSLKID